VGSITWSIELLSDEQADALRKHVEAHSLDALKRDARLREDCAIEFACQAALNDGNAYTVPEAIELLTKGHTPPGVKLYTDGLQLLRLRAAYLRCVDMAAWPEGRGDDAAT
jgi:hypothetical protein